MDPVIMRHEEFMRLNRKHEEMKMNKKLDQEPDMVNQPPHYTQGDIECIDAIRSALGPQGFAAFCRGNIIKYNWRCDHKAGVQDVEKAGWYLERLIDTMRTKPEHSNPPEEEELHK